VIQDIRIDVRWRSHPKRAKLAFLLGHDGTGYVLDLWISTAQSKPDGVLRGLDDMDIALMAGWAGKPADFVAALLGTRLLDRLPDGTLALHDWAEHQPWVIGAPERSEKAKKAIKARWDKAKGGQPEDAEGWGRVVDESRKMPEAGPKNGETIPGEYGEYTPRIQQVIPEPQSSNTPLLSLPSPKGRKTPPERATALSTPKGGEGQTAKRFIAPSLEDITAYCTERQNGIDPQAVLDHYTANGWKVGKNPMRDWRAAVRTWEAKRRSEQRWQMSQRPQSPAERLLAENAGGTTR